MMLMDAFLFLESCSSDEDMALAAGQIAMRSGVDA
jgi:hypothetical protein